jgi:hypothetical protein
MQQIAFQKIVCCAWRCKIALRIESRIVALHLSSNKETKVEASGRRRHHPDGAMVLGRLPIAAARAAVSQRTARRRG